MKGSNESKEYMLSFLHYFQLNIIKCKDVKLCHHHSLIRFAKFNQRYPKTVRLVPTLRNKKLYPKVSKIVRVVKTWSSGLINYQHVDLQKKKQDHMYNVSLLIISRCCMVVDQHPVQSHHLHLQVNLWKHWL